MGDNLHKDILPSNTSRISYALDKGWHGKYMNFLSINLRPHPTWIDVETSLKSSPLSIP